MKSKFKIGSKVEYADGNTVNLVRHGMVKKIRRGLFNNKYLVKVTNGGLFGTLTIAEWINERDLWECED